MKLENGYVLTNKGVFDDNLLLLNREGYIVLSYNKYTTLESLALYVDFIKDEECVNTIIRLLYVLHKTDLIPFSPKDLLPALKTGHNICTVQFYSDHTKEYTGF